MNNINFFKSRKLLTWGLGIIIIGLIFGLVISYIALTNFFQLLSQPHFFDNIRKVRGVMIVLTSSFYILFFIYFIFLSINKKILKKLNKRLFFISVLIIFTISLITISINFSIYIEVLNDISIIAIIYPFINNIILLIINLLAILSAIYLLIRTIKLPKDGSLFDGLVRKAEKEIE